ncbi:MAG: diguanylate cyclase [Janthinobacterium lividum]
MSAGPAGTRRTWRNALSGIRLTLAALTLVAAGPPVFLLVVDAAGERSRTVAAAASRAATLASLGAEQQDSMIQEAATLLRVLARVPDVRADHDGSCNALLRRVEEDHQRIGILSVIGRNGQVTCNSRDEQPSINLADRPWFIQAMAADNDDLVLGDPAISRSTGTPVVMAAMPLFPPGTAAPDGRKSADTAPEGVLAAVLDLDWFSRLAARIPGAGANVVEIVDLRDGRVLLRSPNPGAPGPDTTEGAGRHTLLPQPMLTQRNPALAAPGLAAAGNEGANPAGASRITGVAPLPGTGGNLVLSVGLPRAAVLAKANARLAAGLAIAVAAAGAALLAAALIADRSLLRPLRRIARKALRLGNGKLGVRIGRLDGAAHELQTLASSLDEMGRRLQARSRELEAAQASLLLSEEHHRLLSTCSSDMITRLDSEFRLTYASPACLDLTGFHPEELVGRPAVEMVQSADRTWLEDTLNAPLQAGKPAARATYRITRKDGAAVWLESIGRPLPGPAGAGYVIVTRDVSARMEMEQHLEEANRLLRGQAMQDPLTALANRRHVDEALGTEFRRSQRLQLPLGILMLDIDRFKAFNDTYGHPAGDVCIRAVADAIRAVLRRPADLAGRYGGEEFAILLPNTDEAGVAATAERVRRGVQEQSLVHAGSEFGIVTISVGGAAIMPPIGNVGPAAFVEAADAALYAAKRGGRNCIRLAAVAVVADEAALMLKPEDSRPPGLTDGPAPAP